MNCFEGLDADDFVATLALALSEVTMCLQAQCGARWPGIYEPKS